MMLLVSAPGTQTPPSQVGDAGREGNQTERANATAANKTNKPIGNDFLSMFLNRGVNPILNTSDRFAVDFQNFRLRSQGIDHELYVFVQIDI